MSHDVFISYSTGDKAVADLICESLEAPEIGISCWTAPRDIVPGVDWSEAIIDAISDSRIMILVLSSQANKSQQVKREVERAVSKGVFIIPFRIEDVPLSKALEYYLSSAHWLDAFTPPLSDHVARLVKTVRRVLPERDAPGAVSIPTAGIKELPSQTSQRPESKKVRVALATAISIIIIVGLVFLINRWRRGSNSDVIPATANASSVRVMTNPIGMEFVWIPWGSFTMGASDRAVQDAYAVAYGYDPGDYSDAFTRELPAHQIKRCGGFQMSRYEVKQAQWEAVMSRDNNPSTFRGPDLPVDNITWDDARAFIQKLNAMNDGYIYSLPAEAQWEYAARAGSTSLFAAGDSLSSDKANFDGRRPYGGAATGVFRNMTRPVGTFEPNAWGLYDMYGNVNEWCEDVWHQNYQGAPTDDCSPWLTGGDPTRHILRGGSWRLGAVSCRSSSRFRDGHANRTNEYGLRVVAVSRP